MDDRPITGPPGPGHDGRRPEPRWLTPADLGVIVAGVALVMAVPSRAPVWSPFLPPPPVAFLAAVGVLRLTLGFGAVLAPVVLARRGRYGGPVRPAERLALGLAALAVLDVLPNLDEAVNAYYALAGSTALDFGAARWLLSATAAVGIVLVVAGLVLLRRRARAGSRVTSAMTVLGIVAGLCLWFWGPCEAARLELPWLLVPSPQGDPSTWGWRAPVVLALRDVVANGPVALTWGLLAAAAVRAWRADRRGGRAGARVWTETAALADAAAAALLSAAVGLAVASRQWPVELVLGVSWVLGVGVVSWWVTGRLGAGRAPSTPARSSAG